MIGISDLTELLTLSVQFVNDGTNKRNLELIDRGLNVLSEVETLSDPSRYAMIQGMRGEFLIRRWQISTVRTDLDTAINLLISAGRDTRTVGSRLLAAKHLHDAAVALVRRFRRRRKIADIDQAIKQLERAVALVVDRSTEDFAEIENLLSSLCEVRNNPPMMIVQMDVDEVDREDITSPHSLANMQAWNNGTNMFSGLKWEHSNQDCERNRKVNDADLRVLFLCTFRDDDTNYVILNTLALAMEGGCGRIDIVSDLRDQRIMENYWRQAFGDDRSLAERIDFTVAENDNWRRHVLQRMAHADAILLHLSPKDIDFPEFPFKPPFSRISDQFWDNFMDAPFIKPITGPGLLREVSYLNRMYRLPRTVIVCDEHYQTSFNDLIAFGGMAGDATDLAGNFVTPRLRAIDKQVGHFRKAYRGITFQSDAGQTVLPALAQSIKGVLSDFRVDDVSSEAIKWQPHDLCSCSPHPRCLPPDGQQKLIQFTNVEDILFLPAGQITEIDSQDVMSILNQEAIRIGCPYCHAPLSKLFFFVDGIREPKWSKEDHDDDFLKAKCQICGHRSSLYGDDALAPQ